MKKAFFFLFAVCILSGCNTLYTQEQVNKTVAAKIKEVASHQRVNITVETIIVKEYVVVTPTIPPAGSPTPIFIPTMTPQGYDRFTGDEALSALSASLSPEKINFKQFFIPADLSIMGPLAEDVKTVSSFEFSQGASSYTGCIYSFDSPEKQKKVFYFLASQMDDVRSGTIFERANLILTVESDTIESMLSSIEEAFLAIR